MRAAVRSIINRPHSGGDSFRCSFLSDTDIKLSAMLVAVQAGSSRILQQLNGPKIQDAQLGLYVHSSLNQQRKGSEKKNNLWSGE